MQGDCLNFLTDVRFLCKTRNKEYTLHYALHMHQIVILKYTFFKDYLTKSMFLCKKVN